MLSRIGSVVLVLGCMVAPSAATAGGLDAAEALAKLKTLEGNWSGAPSAEDVEQAQSADSRHEFRVSAAGSVVMETMFPGTDHEMINMYHVDGEDLLLTHYCSAGNQPHMRLDREASSAERLVFEFAGGTNFDPAKDMHIHSAQLVLDSSGIKSEWTSWNEGKPAQTMTFQLARE